MTLGLLLETKIKSYLLAANDGKPGMSEEVIEEAGEALKSILRKTFNESRSGNFRISMSNMGQPACKLQMERDKAPKEKHTYAFRMKMLIGDITELVLRAVIKGAGIPIEATNQKVTLDLNGAKINGSYDDKFKDIGIIDTKSASGWAYRNKWAGGFDALEKSDDFGYLGQLFGYAEADKSKAGGWLVVNKETGELMFVEAKDTPELRAKHLKKCEENVFKVIDPSIPFQRCFEDVEEKHRKQPTGNRMLGYSCSMCDFKFSCWPGLVHRTAVKSEAENPPMVYYTKLDDSTIKTHEEKKAVYEKKLAKKKNAALSKDLNE